MNVTAESVTSASHNNKKLMFSWWMGLCSCKVRLVKLCWHKSTEELSVCPSYSIHKTLSKFWHPLVILSSICFLHCIPLFFYCIFYILKFYLVEHWIVLSIRTWCLTPIWLKDRNTKSSRDAVVSEKHYYAFNSLWYAWKHTLLSLSGPFPFFLGTVICLQIRLFIVRGFQSSFTSPPLWVFSDR